MKITMLKSITCLIIKILSSALPITQTDNNLQENCVMFGSLRHDATKSGPCRRRYLALPIKFLDPGCDLDCNPHNFALGIITYQFGTCYSL